MSGITLRQLEIFAQVVEHGSFRRCAEFIGVSQVSISEHVRELESRLGVQLFDRHSGGPSTLTAEGTRAHRRVVAILADLNDLMWDVSGGRAGISRKMTVAMHPFLMRYVAEALALFRSRHPEVEVKLELLSAAGEELMEAVAKRVVDIAYFFAFDGQHVPESTVVRIEPLGIFVGQSHALAAKAIVSAADIRSTPAIHLGAKNPLRILVDRAMEQSGAGGSPLGLETDEYGLILTSVYRNQGFACMFSAVADEVSQTNGLVCVPLENPIPALQVRELVRHSARHDAIAKELSDTLTASLH